MIGFYNRDEKCLQRGTNWVFQYSSMRFAFKGLIFMAVKKPLIFSGIAVGPNNFDVYTNLLKAKVNLSSIL